MGTRLLGLLAIVVTLTGGPLGCAAAKYRDLGQERLGREQLGAALEYLHLSLVNKPGDVEVQELMRGAAQRAYDEGYRDAAGFETSGKWDRAVAAYDRVTAVAALVAATPPGGYPTPKEDLGERRAAAVTKAAELFYNRGMEAMDRGENQDAARAFRCCLAFQPGYEDAEALYARAREAAMKMVAVRSVAADASVQGTARTLADGVLALAQQRRPEFIDFIDLDTLDDRIRHLEGQYSGMFDESTLVDVGKQIGVSIFCDVRLNEVRATDTGWQEKREERSQEVDDVRIRTARATNPDGSTYTYEENYVAGKKTVRATIVTHTRTTSAAVKGSFKIVDVGTGKTLTTGQIDYRKEDPVSYKTYDGDAEAIGPLELLTMSMSGAEREPESPDSMKDAMISNAATDVAKSLTRFFQ